MSKSIGDDDVFKPAWWLRGAHAQTIWPTLMRRVTLDVRRQRFELPDGDFIDVDWAQPDPADAPIVVILHGLEGSIQSSYVRGMLRACAGRGWRGCVMHFRGCSGQSNRLWRGYHSGDTADVAWFIKQLQATYPGTPIAAIGYSLGGNVLLKWLGQTGGDNPLTAAAAVSVPFELHAAAGRLECGISRLYQRHLLTCLRRSVRAKLQHMDGEPPIDVNVLDRLRTFYEFDDAITAPLHGFDGVDDYYTRSSCRQYLPGIARPTLIVHARNDPFMTPDAIPHDDELPASVTLRLTGGGGHVGFVGGRVPWRPVYWLERIVPTYLFEHLPRR